MTRKEPLSRPPPDEATLVARAARNDQDAIAALYDLYAPKIYSYIYHRTSDQIVTEDLTGQVFLRMIEAVKAERAWHTSFSGWLYRIAHNLVVDYYRRRGRAIHTDIDESPNIPAHNSDPYKLAAAILDSDALVRAIGELTEEQAQVVTLRFLEGYNIAEVAEILGKTEGAIKALQYRGVASLRRIMKNGQ
ncbi:MAG: sigma-70 family RNA polymerase sigma factor [Chloroflexi bacterium]|nr:sigma-70 family RNA polymerase sigma factor [Chloroflexota bacterium]